MELETLITKYNQIAESLSDANALVEDLKLQKTGLRNQIIESLKAAGLTAAAADGKTMQIVSKKQYSILDVDAFAALDDVYHTASLFSVNSNKLNSFCKDIEATMGEVPEDLAATLRAYEYEDLSVRKIR